MSYFRISTVAADVALSDLGYTVVHPATNLVLSNQFSIEDLQNSEDLVAAVVGGSVTAQINLDGVWTAVNAANFTGDEIYAAAANIHEIVTTVDNQRLVDGSDASTGTELHHHDSTYYTETELNATAAGALLGIDDTGWTNLGPATTVQQTFNQIDGLFDTLVTLDAAYDNDSNGILAVDNLAKNLDFESDNANDILISRKSGLDKQSFLKTSVSGDELCLGEALVGALAEINVRVKTNLIIDGNLTITGTTTDTTVNELNVTNASIRLRDGAAAIAGANGYIEIERGTSGADARLEWDETADRWIAGIVGDMATVALLEKDEVVSGVYEFQGGAATEPSMFLTNKAAAPTVLLGSASQIPMAMINNKLAVYDKTNSRNKFLSVDKTKMAFLGRDNANNTAEYARFAGGFTSNQASIRIPVNMTLIGISIQTSGSATWSARIRKNGSATNLASLSATAASGAVDNTFNVDFNASDVIEVFIDGTSINRPVIVIEFAERF